jgi:hypothetical protein
MLVILFAFLLASLAAAMVIAVSVMLPEWSDLLAQSMQHGVFSIVVGFGAVVLSALALLPAVIVVMLAEAMRLRSLLFYAAAGGLGLLALYYGLGLAPMDARVGREFEIVAAAGIVGGLVYWALAGRNAGRWLDRAA